VIPVVSPPIKNVQTAVRTLTYAQLKRKAINLDLDIRRTIRATKSPKAQQAAEHAADNLAHQVVEWLETARKREEVE